MYNGVAECIVKLHKNYIVSVSMSTNCVNIKHYLYNLLKQSKVAQHYQ